MQGTMDIVDTFGTGHTDLIHCISYNFYGKRMATCSSDQNIMIYDELDYKWTLSSKIPLAHTGPIWKVIWASPVFGHILASCSFDKTVCVWLEIEIAKEGGQQKSWKKINNFELKDSIKDIKFGPSELGLILGVCTSEGRVAIYESAEKMRIDSLELIGGPIVINSNGCNAIDFNPNPSQKMFIVACNDQSDIPNKLERHLGGIGASGGGLIGESDGLMQLFQWNDKDKKYIRKYIFSKEEGHTKSVNDVSWAPHGGRSFHLIASASSDSTFKIWKLKFIDDEGGLQINCEKMATIDAHQNPVYIYIYYVGKKMCMEYIGNRIIYQCG